MLEEAGVALIVARPPFGTRDLPATEESSLLA